MTSKIADVAAAQSAYQRRRRPCALCGRVGDWRHDSCGTCRKALRPRKESPEAKRRYERLHRVRQRIGPPRELPPPAIVAMDTACLAKPRDLRRLARWLASQAVDQDGLNDSKPYPLDVVLACERHRMEE